MGRMIYSDISSQRRPKGGVPNNWILIQDSDTKKGSFLTNVKESLTEKITPFLNKMKTKKKNVKTIISKKISRIILKGLPLNSHHKALHRKMV